MKIIRLCDLNPRARKKAMFGMTYFQVWSNKVNTANFVIEGVTDNLDNRSNQDNFNNSSAIIEKCKELKISCQGVMIHHGKGCYWHQN